MSYDISFRAKVEGTNSYVDLGATDANITWNVSKIIRLSTGLEWKNEQNNGKCEDVMPLIEKGLQELELYPEKYKPYEAPNGWGTVEGTIQFFKLLLRDWGHFVRDNDYNLVQATTFWIM